MHNRSVLISGAGVVGPTLAYWLLQRGFEPVIVERAPRFRTGGYIVDFWGVGYDVAEKMGILPAIYEKGYQVKELRIVDEHGRQVGGFDTSILSKATHNRFLSIPRGDLAAEIYRTIEGKVEVIFGDSIKALTERSDGVRVAFEHAPMRQFDLVIGADGLHSKVRELAFGSEDHYEKHLGYLTAAFEVRGYPKRDEDVYFMFNVPGKQVARFAMHDDKTLFFFVFSADTEEIPDPHDTAAHKAALHRAFDTAGWECEDIMQAMDACDEIYFDRVSQIHMSSWHKSRIALVGDAAFCPSLLAGEGTSLGMAGAYVLAHTLATHEGNPTAFREYETRYRPLMERKQRAAAKFASSFAPRTAFGLIIRNAATRLLTIPFLGNLLLGNSLRDDFTLP